MSNTFDIERCLLDLAQTNILVKNIGGHQFQLMTLTSSIREDLEHEEDLTELLERAANFGLSIKSERALDFDGMTDEKLSVFWSNKAFETEGDVSLREQFGQAVLEESGMTDMIDALTEDEVTIGDIDVTSLEEDANSYQPNIN